MSVSLFEKQPAHNPLANVLARAGEIILGKDRQIKMAMCCILARGHLLIEDVPGVGKTTLSHVIASLLGLQYQRIQFTSDLLPADVVGVSIFDRESSTFRFHPGPIFSQVILADEISPDGCRLWDMTTNEKLDKDRFRRDLGGEVEAYQEVARRLGLLPEGAENVVLDLDAQRKKRGR